MKIVIDLTSLADNFSGIERFALNTAKELLRLDQKNQYLLVFKGEVYPEFRGYSGSVEMTVLPVKKKLWFYQVTLCRALKRINADYYLFPAFPSPYFFRKKGIIDTIHDLGCWDCPETMTKKMVLYFRLMYRKAAKHSEKILTVSEFSRRRIQRILKVQPEKIKVVYNGVSENIYQQGKTNWEQIRGRYHIRKPYMLCLSTLEPRKNISLLISAYGEMLEETGCRYDLVLAGRRGWKLDKLLDTVFSESRGRVIITGHVAEEDLPGIYRNAELFVFPSIYEGFGIPPLEAMAAGKPVICSDIEVLRETLGEHAVYFKSDDKESLKTVLCAFMDGKLEVPSPDELMRFSKRYTYKRTAKKIYEIL